MMGLRFILVIGVVSILVGGCRSSVKENLSGSSLRNVATESNLNYEVLRLMRCVCKASMELMDSSGRRGFVMNDAKPAAVRIGIVGTSDEIHLLNPQRGVRSYYGVATNDEEVWNQARAQGIEIPEGAQFRLISVVGNFTLYPTTRGNEEQ